MAHRPTSVKSLPLKSMPALVLLNPHAQGGRAARRAPMLQRWLMQNAPQTEFAAPDSVQEAHARLRALPRGSRVVAVGGDGTLNRWLPALLDGGHALGVVPMGSGNDIARALGVHALSLDDALSSALRGPLRRMDVGVVEAESLCVPFLSSLAAGFDAAVGLRALCGPRWLRGQPRYLWATLRELAALRCWPVRLSCDGRPVWMDEVLFASTLNTPTYGSGMPVAPQARADDGRLEVLRAAEMSRAHVLALLPRLLRGTHLTDPRVALQACTSLTLDSDAAPLPVAADGEYLGQFRQLRVRVMPAALPAAVA